MLQLTYFPNQNFCTWDFIFIATSLYDFKLNCDCIEQNISAVENILSAFVIKMSQPFK